MSEFVWTFPCFMPLSDSDDPACIAIDDMHRALCVFTDSDLVADMYKRPVKAMRFTDARHLCQTLREWEPQLIAHDIGYIAVDVTVGKHCRYAALRDVIDDLATQ